MAFRARINGIEVEADTEAELRVLLALAAGQGGSSKPAPALEQVVDRATPSGKERPATWVVFIQDVRDADSQQFKLLQALTPTNGLSGQELQARLGFTSGLPLRGLLIGLVRRARKLGIQARPIRTAITRSEHGRKRHYQYSLHRDLLPLMRQEPVGWGTAETANKR